MFWILLGVLFVLCVRNNFDAQGVAKDVRAIAKSVRKIVRDLVRTVRHAAAEAKKENAEARKARAEEKSIADAVPAAVPVQTVAQKENELLKELEQHARTAAMMVNVPTLAFPEDDPKYDSSRKYTYA